MELAKSYFPNVILINSLYVFLYYYSIVTDFALYNLHTKVEQNMYR